MASPLLQYTAALDSACLPRILRVCSGVYFQGSVYELSGNEVCFSTGDVIKVIGLELSAVSCQDVGSGETFELPVNHAGLLKAVPDVPLATRGDFYVPEATRRFTPREIVTSAHLRGRRFRFDDGGAARQSTLVLSPVYQIRAIMSLRKDVLRFPSSLPVDVADITDACQDVSFIAPLSLPEVHAQSEQSFPAVVEVLEAPESPPVLKSAWLPWLQRGARLIFHGSGTSPMTVAAGAKSRKEPARYFLVSERYAGRFRRRPRAFRSAYELYVACAQRPGLRVSAARDCEEAEEEGLPGLSVGERLQVVACEKVQLACGLVDAVVCVRLRDDDDEGEDEEEDEVGAGGRQQGGRLYLPLHMQGHFVELLSDNKKYALSALADELPLDVKAVSRDPQLEDDPLVTLPSLRLVGVTLEPTIRASFPHTPHLCFEIPTRRLCLSVCHTQQPPPWPPNRAPECTVERVTEVTEGFLQQFRQEALPALTPPPRPPKTHPSAPRADAGVLTQDFGDMTIASRRSSSPLPPAAGVSHRPLMVASRQFSTPQPSVRRAAPNGDVGVASGHVNGPAREDAAVESDDDGYERVDDTLTATLKKAQESGGFF